MQAQDIGQDTEMSVKLGSHNWPVRRYMRYILQSIQKQNVAFWLDQGRRRIRRYRNHCASYELSSPIQLSDNYFRFMTRGKRHTVTQDWKKPCGRF